MTFNELNLNQSILDAIKKSGYTEPAPIQEKAIPTVEAGRDLIACAQTGTGKTAAFALPVLNKLEKTQFGYIRCLVLTPTRELAQQIFENFKKYGRYMDIRCACIYGGAKEKPQIINIKRGCDVLIATPGRLIDFMDRGLVTLAGIQIFVLDEADRMLDMGFIHDIRKVAASLKPEHETLMFSATMPRPIENLAQELLKNPEVIKVAPTTNPAETVDQKIVFTAKDNKKLALGEMLQEDGVKKAIVFTRTKHGADHLVKDLNKLHIDSIAIHGDKTQGQRQNALERFRAGKTKILVATDVAARGIDVPGVSHVFNYELPDEPESYIHRIGRSGRAGKDGIAVSFCCDEEKDKLYDIEKMMDREIPEIETEYTIAFTRKKPAKRFEKNGGRFNHKGGRMGDGRQGRNDGRRGGQGYSKQGRKTSKPVRNADGSIDKSAVKSISNSGKARSYAKTSRSNDGESRNYGNKNGYGRQNRGSQIPGGRSGAGRGGRRSGGKQTA